MQVLRFDGLQMGLIVEDRPKMQLEYCKVLTSLCMQPERWLPDAPLQCAARVSTHLSLYQRQSRPGLDKEEKEEKDKEGDAAFTDAKAVDDGLGGRSAYVLIFASLDDARAATESVRPTKASDMVGVESTGPERKLPKAQFCGTDHVRRLSALTPDRNKILRTVPIRDHVPLFIIIGETDRVGTKSVLLILHASSDTRASAAVSNYKGCPICASDKCEVACNNCKSVRYCSEAHREQHAIMGHW